LAAIHFLIVPVGSIGPRQRLDENPA